MSNRPNPQNPPQKKSQKKKQNLRKKNGPSQLSREIEQAQRAPRRNVNPSANPRDYGDQMGSIMRQGYGQTLSMTPSTAAFASSYVNPWLPLEVRLPVFPIVRSVCKQNRAQAVVTANSDGIAWGIFSPANTVCSDFNYAFITAGPAAPPNMAFAGTNVNGVQCASEFTSTSFRPVGLGGKGLALRVNTFGISLKNITKKFDQGGEIWFGQISPINQNLEGANGTTLEKYPGYKLEDISNGSFHSFNRAITASCDEFFNFMQPSDGGYQWAYTDTNGASSENNWYFGFWLSTAPGAQFTLETVVNYEVYGQTTNFAFGALTTPDRASYENVVGTVAQRRHAGPTVRDHAVGSTGTGTLKKIGTWLREHGPKLLDIGSKVAPLILGI